MNTIIMPTHSQIRQELREKRKNLSAQQQQQASRQLLKDISVATWFVRAKRIACYLPTDGEIDTWPIILRAWEMGKKIYLPAISQQDNGILQFLSFTSSTNCSLNRYGLVQPSDRSTKVAISSLDLMLVPLVGFNGIHRLGMGGGFYDKTLAKPGYKQPLLVGLGHQCQFSKHIKSRSWDIPMDKMLIA